MRVATTSWINKFEDVRKLYDCESLELLKYLRPKFKINLPCDFFQKPQRIFFLLQSFLRSPKSFLRIFKELPRFLMNSWAPSNNLQSPKIPLKTSWISLDNLLKSPFQLLISYWKPLENPQTFHWEPPKISSDYLKNHLRASINLLRFCWEPSENPLRTN